MPETSRQTPRLRGLWRAEVVLETDGSEQPEPEWSKVSGDDFRDNSLSEKCVEGFFSALTRRRLKPASPTFDNSSRNLELKESRAQGISRADLSANLSTVAPAKAEALAKAEARKQKVLGVFVS